MRSRILCHRSRQVIRSATGVFSQGGRWELHGGQPGKYVPAGPVIPDFVVQLDGVYDFSLDVST